jgi:hypothetical protein
MEVTRSFETSVLTRPTRRHIPEDGNLHSHRRENLKSCIGDVLCEVRVVPTEFFPDFLVRNL